MVGHISRTVPRSSRAERRLWCVWPQGRVDHAAQCRARQSDGATALVCRMTRPASAGTMARWVREAVAARPAVAAASRPGGPARARADRTWLRCRPVAKPPGMRGRRRIAGSASRSPVTGGRGRFPPRMGPTGDSASNCWTQARRTTARYW